MRALGLLLLLEEQFVSGYERLHFLHDCASLPSRKLTASWKVEDILDAARKIGARDVVPAQAALIPPGDVGRGDLGCSAPAGLHPAELVTDKRLDGVGFVE